MWTSAPDAWFSGTTSTAGPTIATVATPSTVTVGGSASDQATVSGGDDPGGSITWTLFPASDTGCAGTPLFTSSAVSVAGDGTYAPPDSFTTGAAGSYQWKLFRSAVRIPDKSRLRRR